MPKVQAPWVDRYRSLTPGDIVIIPAYSRCPSSTYSALNSRLDPEGRVDYECLRNAHAFEKEDRLGVVVYVPKVVESFLTCYVLVAVLARGAGAQGGLDQFTYRWACTFDLEHIGTRV